MARICQVAKAQSQGRRHVIYIVHGRPHSRRSGDIQFICSDDLCPLAFAMSSVSQLDWTALF